MSMRALKGHRIAIVDNRCSVCQIENIVTRVVHVPKEYLHDTTVTMDYLNTLGARINSCHKCGRPTEGYVKMR